MIEHINNEVLTTKEVIEYLCQEWGESPSINTIYYYVRAGKLKPKYEDNWRIEGTMQFDRAVVEDFAKEYKRPEGYTLSEVSNIVSLHVNTLQQYIKDGSLDASKFIFKGKATYFVSNDSLASFQEKDYVNKSKAKRKTFFTKDKKFYLFQSFRNETTNDYGRIISIEKNLPILLTAHGKEIIGAAILSNGYEPIYKVGTFKRITKKIYASFEFILPNDIKSKDYRLFDFIYNYIGAENINIESDHQKVTIKIKPLFAHLNEDELQSYKDAFTLFETLLKEGTVQVRHNGLYIGTHFESITLNVPKSIKEQLRKLADESGLSIEDYLKDKLLNELNEVAR